MYLGAARSSGHRRARRGVRTSRWVAAPAGVVWRVVARMVKRVVKRVVERVAQNGEALVTSICRPARCIVNDLSTKLPLYWTMPNLTRPYIITVHVPGDHVTRAHRYTRELNTRVTRALSSDQSLAFAFTNVFVFAYPYFPNGC